MSRNIDRLPAGAAYAARQNYPNGYALRERVTGFRGERIGLYTVLIGEDNVLSIQPTAERIGRRHVLGDAKRDLIKERQAQVEQRLQLTLSGNVHAQMQDAVGSYRFGSGETVPLVDVSSAGVRVNPNLGDAHHARVLGGTAASAVSEAGAQAQRQMLAPRPRTRAGATGRELVPAGQRSGPPLTLTGLAFRAIGWAGSRALENHRQVLSDPVQLVRYQLNRALRLFNAEIGGEMTSRMLAILADPITHQEAFVALLQSSMQFAAGSAAIDTNQGGLIRHSMNVHRHLAERGRHDSLNAVGGIRRGSHARTVLERPISGLKPEQQEQVFQFVEAHLLPAYYVGFAQALSDALTQGDPRREELLAVINANRSLLQTEITRLGGVRMDSLDRFRQQMAFNLSNATRQS